MVILREIKSENDIELDEADENLNMHHETVFNMSHKIIKLSEAGREEKPDAS